MHIFWWIVLCLPLSFSLQHPPAKPISRTIMISDKYPDSKTLVQTKMSSISQLIRSENIAPTILLCFTGGFIQSKNAKTLLKSKDFIASSLITLCIMANSMIVNDLFDMSVDKINNPSRPLITGEIKPREAIAMFAVITAAAELLTRQLPDPTLRAYARSAMITITLYTPLFKKIPLVKNVICCSLIAFSILFCGSTVSTNNPLPLLIATQHVFAGSLHNELLLDIRDVEGDKAANINTIPVLFGKMAAWKLARFFIIADILIIISKMSYQSIPLLIATIPVLYNLHILRTRDFDKNSIIFAVKKTTLPLFVSLLYLCSRV
jgi:geranylgeranylglycerol-phosphate geranylgeranyltransferase